MSCLGCKACKSVEVRLPAVSMSATAQTAPVRACSAALVCRTGATMTAIGSDIFIYGGQEPSTGVCFSEVIKVDTCKWQWSVLQPASGKPPARHSHCAGKAHEHGILVYGGAGQQSMCAAAPTALPLCCCCTRPGHRKVEHM